MKDTSLVLGKLSGRHAFRDKLEAMGYALDDEAFEDAFRASRIWPTRRSMSSTRTSSPWWTTRSCAATTPSRSRTLRVETGTGIVPGSPN